MDWIKCPGLFQTMSKRKILSYFGSERGETKLTKKKKKLKMNSQTRKNREKKMILNFWIRNLAISRGNGWMITKSLHKNWPQKQAKYFSPKFADDNIDIEGPVAYKEWSMRNDSIIKKKCFWSCKLQHLKRCGAKINITGCEDYENTFARIESDCTLRFGFKVLM